MGMFARRCSTQIVHELRATHMLMYGTNPTPCMVCQGTGGMGNTVTFRANKVIDCIWCDTIGFQMPIILREWYNEIMKEREKTMAAPEGFPFNRISKEFGIPYEKVLAFAHNLKTGKPVSGYTQADMHNDEFSPMHEWVRQATRACLDFVQMQEGRLDWQTGEYRS